MMHSSAASPHTQLFSEHSLAKAFHWNRQEGLPQILILPEYHVTETKRKSAEREALDRRVNQAVIDQLYEPGDIVLVEQPAGGFIDQSTLPQTKDLKKRVRVLGWDDPVSMKKLNDVYSLYAVSLAALMEDNYGKASETKEYKEALTVLQKQDYQNWSDLQIPFTADELPAPTMDEDTYWRAIQKTQFTLLDHFYNIIPTLYSPRQASLVQAITGAFEHYQPGRVFVLGGYSHFMPTKKAWSDSKQNALDVFYQVLHSTDLSAAILTPPNASRKIVKVERD